MKEAIYERGVDADGRVVDAAAVELQDLVDRLAAKADVSWVQRELQRLWDAFDSRAMPVVASSSNAASSPLLAGVGSLRPASAPSQGNDFFVCSLSKDVRKNGCFTATANTAADFGDKNRLCKGNQPI